jgi:hypothetical protein
MNTTSSESPKRPDAKHEAEIVEIKDGLPKVKEYWEMVKKEMDTLLDNATLNNVS